MCARLRKPKNITPSPRRALAVVLAIIALFLASCSGEAEPEAFAPTEPAAVAETLPSVEIGKILLDEEPVHLGVGRGVDVLFELYPENATGDALNISVDPANIAAVSFEEEDGHILRVTGIAPGKATLTLSAGTVVARKPLAVVEVLPEDIRILSEPQVPREGTQGAFTPVFAPLDVTNRALTWQSDAPEVLRVDADGRFEALAMGEATITATHESGVAGALLVEVLPAEVETISLTSDWQDGKPFRKNDTMTLTPEILPENAAEKSLTWYSSDESVATVSKKGVVKAVAAGNAVITAEAVNGRTGTWELLVAVSPQKFRISASISMKSNDHVGNHWTSGFECNDREIRTGATVSLMPGDAVTVCGWAQDNDSRPDYGSYWEQLTLTDEMCKSGFTIEGDAEVYENSGRYSGNCAVWHVKVTFTPTK